MSGNQKKRESAIDYFKKNPSASVYGLSKEPGSQDYFVDSYVKTNDQKIYYLERLLGAGGGASVYSAIDENGNHCAIKCCYDAGDGLDQAKKEAKFYVELGLLRSPTLEYDDRAAGLNYLIIPMHYFPGKTLANYLQENPNNTLDQRYELAMKLCLVVEKLHRQGIAHGDLKPENIMINEHGELHLIDFGCATTALDKNESYESTTIYKFSDDVQLTRRQADLVALMRCLFMDDSFLTAENKNYKRAESDQGVFNVNDAEMAPHIKEKIQPLLSTSIRDAKHHITLPDSALDIARTLALTSLRPIRTLTRGALEYAKMGLPSNSDILEYVNVLHHNKHPESNLNDKQALKQALRIVAHTYSKLSKMNLVTYNPFFYDAVAAAKIDHPTLSQTLYARKPSGISTYGTLFQKPKIDPIEKARVAEQDAKNWEIVNRYLTKF